MAMTPEQLRQLADDIENRDKPWELWELEYDLGGNKGTDWLSFAEHGFFTKNIRRKPEIAELAGIQYPKPLDKPPEMHSVYYVVIANLNTICEWNWTNSSQDNTSLNSKMSHSTREAAELQLKAIRAALGCKDD